MRRGTTVLAVLVLSCGLLASQWASKVTLINGDRVTVFAPAGWSFYGDATRPPNRPLQSVSFVPSRDYSRSLGEPPTASITIQLLKSADARKLDLERDGDVSRTYLNVGQRRIPLQHEHSDIADTFEGVLSLPKSQLRLLLTVGTGTRQQLFLTDFRRDFEELAATLKIQNGR